MKKLLPFFMSFFISLSFFMLPLYMAVVPEKEAEKVTQNIIIPKPRYSVFLLKGKEELYFYALKMEKGELSALILGDEKLSDMGEEKTAHEIYSNGGLKYLPKALKIKYNTDFNIYFSLTVDDFAELFGIYGSCDINLPMDIYDENKNLLFKKGRQLINAEGASCILEKSVLPKEKRQEIIWNICAGIKKEKGGFREYERERLWEFISNRSENNLSVTDFLSYEKYDFMSEQFYLKPFVL